jgi:putative FmdB family regulatory protein
MPIYEFLCARCGKVVEAFQKVGDPPPRRCDACGGRKLSKLVSRSAFQLKGGGWYADLYAKKGAPAGEKGEGPAAGPGADAGKATDAAKGGEVAGGTGDAKGAGTQKEPGGKSEGSGKASAPAGGDAAKAAGAKEGGSPRGASAARAPRARRRRR